MGAAVPKFKLFPSPVLLTSVPPVVEFPVICAWISRIRGVRRHPTRRDAPDSAGPARCRRPPATGGRRSAPGTGIRRDDTSEANMASGTDAGNGRVQRGSENVAGVWLPGCPLVSGQVGRMRTRAEPRSRFRCVWGRQRWHGT